MEYREPFTGGGSIAISLLPHINRIAINDKDPAIAAMWNSIINHHDLLKSKVRNFTPSISAFDSFKSELLATKEVAMTTSKIVELGFKKMALHRISYSGMGTMSFGPKGGRLQNKCKIDDKYDANGLCNRIDTLHADFNRITIQEGGCTSNDFEELVCDNSAPALIFVDSPYVTAGPELYQFSFTHADHVRLAESMRKCPHNFLMTYDDHELIHDLYGSWCRIERIGAKYTVQHCSEERTPEKYELFITPKK